MADAFDDENENEQTYTMNEYMEKLEAEELEADLVLGGDEGKECTYPNGYMKRQAIFSCLTCVPNGSAGVCTACSLVCHDGHEMVELWTKRKFRCDCGNSKFGEVSCKLCPIKDSENADNSYNHNFKGSYCTCGRPYPDPEAEEQVEMIQCCICEDWFHENHLGLDSVNEIPRDEEDEPLYDEYICQECSLNCSFLDLYPASVWATPKQKNDTAPSGKEENSLKTGKSPYACPEQNVINSSSIHSEHETALIEKDSVHGENMEKTSDLAIPEEHSLDRASSLKCILGVDVNIKSHVLGKKMSMFLSKGWRDLLCRCRTCYEFYSGKGIDYLIDKEDSLQEYEKMAKEKREEKLQQQEGDAMKFINTLDHVRKIEIMSGINDMANELKSFMESVGTSRTITSDDVRGVFENLAKKRQRFQ
ncbi:putative E3 ubiquitin-protein ligase UBR7 [Asparagus officinalis]|nr:putative E3 ubiquitin-protein ligase UBR7 [Asparagus officinalis]